MATKRTSSTLPSRTTSFAMGSADYSRLSGAKKAALSRPDKGVERAKVNAINGHEHIMSAPIYTRMQSVIQLMLHSERGVPIKSHKRRIISAIPSAFTGSDMVNWLTKNLSIETKAEAIHLANLFCRHGYFFCIEGVSLLVKDDGSLFRFQTPYYWPSQNPDISDFAYGVYLVKQVMRSKHRIRLLDYELNNLHKLKLRLAKEWWTITEKADEDVKVFKEQKRVAKAIMTSQEEAFWRLYRPLPGDVCVADASLTRHGTQPLHQEPSAYTDEELERELAFLKRSMTRTRMKVSTCVENMRTYFERYKEFDPMLTPPLPSNPWITGDTTFWTVEKSLVEHPTERHVKKWSCSLLDLLNDVTGRFKFEQFCKAQFNLENIRFWQACRDLKSIPLTAVPGSVQLVYDEFLQRGAVSEVNVSASVQEEIEADLKNPTRFAFTSAQEQIFQLMQNDIYPRFLKSDEYKELLRKGREVDEAGKGFFAKLQRKKVELVKQDASGISPCLPQRYTKRQLSISRKMSTTGSSSLDNLFLASNVASASTPFTVETKRNSAYTEAFIESLMAPNPTTQKKPCAEPCRPRRLSAPGGPPKLEESISPLDDISEDQQQQVGGVAEYGHAPTMVIDGTLPMSYSADDLQQLMEDADTIGASKWKKFGIAAGIDFTDTDGGSDLNILGAPLRSVSQGWDAVPVMDLASSPRHVHGGTGTLDLESAERLAVSSDSIHSATSH